MTKLSYIVSCYNSEGFLPDLLNDLLAQDEQDIEIIVVDSDSTDYSYALAKLWEATSDNIRVVKQKNRTPYGVSWLEGWKAAKGQVVGNSNTDDRSYQWRTRQVYNAYRRHLESSDIPGFFYGGYETRINNTVTARGIPPKFSVDDMSNLFRCGIHVHWENDLRRLVDWSKMYKAGFEYKSAFDYWLVLYFMSLGAVGVPIASCFSIYNQRPDSLEQSDKERNTFESLRAIETFFPDSIAINNLENQTKYDNPGFYNRYQEFKNNFNN